MDYIFEVNNQMIPVYVFDTIIVGSGAAGSQPQSAFFF